MPIGKYNKQKNKQKAKKNKIIPEKEENELAQGALIGHAAKRLGVKPHWKHEHQRHRGGIHQQCVMIKCLWKKKKMSFYEYNVVLS